MIHISRTHRVALDSLFDRINLDPKIQIKYVATKNQLADILTKGNFTCDEWNHLLHLFNISLSRSASCPEAMSKRMQQGTGEERVVAKSKPTLNLVSHAATSSYTGPSSSASYRPGILRAPSQQGSSVIVSAGQPAAGGSNQNDAALSSQVWQRDAKTNDSECARKLAAENSDINDEDDSKWPHNYRISRANVPHLEKVYSFHVCKSV